MSHVSAYASVLILVARTFLVLSVVVLFRSHKQAATDLIRFIVRYCNFYILPFWLEIAYSRPFGGVVWGHISPKYGHPSF